MDVAEQALTALETLSKKHAKIILQAVSRSVQALSLCDKLFTADVFSLSQIRFRNFRTLAGSSMRSFRMSTPPPHIICLSLPYMQMC